jgi:putative Ca2+/H+ antiporter (TMEM165/GDT1 family)
MSGGNRLKQADAASFTSSATETSFAKHMQMDAFFSSLMMILVSELGDKTFFIAAVMAMKHSRGVVLAGQTTPASSPMIYQIPIVSCFVHPFSWSVQTQVSESMYVLEVRV